MKMMTQRLDKMGRMSHTEGVKALEAALSYMEQQEEVTASDVMCLRHCQDLMVRKRSNAGK